MISNFVEDERNWSLNIKNLILHAILIFSPMYDNVYYGVGGSLFEMCKSFVQS